MKATWDFGDGTTSNATNPLHIYRAPGIYTVGVRVSSDDTNDTGMVYGNCVYGEHLYKGVWEAGEDVDFYALPAWGQSELAVQFTLLATTAGIEEKIDYIHITSWSSAAALDPSANIQEVLDALQQGLHVSYTTQCLRLSLRPSCGRGWAEFGGEYWPFPEARVGSLKVLDNLENEHLVIHDATHGRLQEVGVRNQFKDAAGNYGGYDIPCRVEGRQEIGSAEHYFLKSLEHHIHMHPYDENNKGEDGYTDSGFQNGFEIDFGLRKDGEAAENTLQTKQIPLEGDITFRYDEEAHRWQPVLNTNMSEWKLTKLRNYYIAMDRNSKPDNRVMTEQTWQNQLANCAIYLARNTLNPLLNYATGGMFTGSYLSKASGPDGRQNSALLFVADGGLTSDVRVSLSGDFTLAFWVSGLGSGTNRIAYMNSGFSLFIDVGKDTTLRYSDNHNNLEALLAWNAALTWHHIVVTRSGDMLQVYEDKELVLSRQMRVDLYSDYVHCMQNCTGSLFDFRIVNGAIDSDIVTFANDDVLKKEGKATCPLF